MASILRITCVKIITPMPRSLTTRSLRGFNFLMVMLIALFVTISARKLGTQLCMAVGAIVVATCFISAFFVKEVWQIYLSQGLLVGFGVGFTYVPSAAILL